MTAPIGKAVVKHAEKRAATRSEAKGLISSTYQPKHADKELVEKKSSPKDKTVSKTVRKKSIEAKRTWMPGLRPAKSTVRYRQVLAFELVVGSIVILTQRNPEEKGKTNADKQVSESIQQLVAFLLVMFILSAMTTAGPSAARFSATLGGVILLVLLTKNTDIWGKLVPPGFRQSEAVGMPGVFPFPGTGPSNLFPHSADNPAPAPGLPPIIGAS